MSYVAAYSDHQIWSSCKNSKERHCNHDINALSVKTTRPFLQGHARSQKTPCSPLPLNRSTECRILTRNHRRELFFLAKMLERSTPMFVVSGVPARHCDGPVCRISTGCASAPTLALCVVCFPSAAGELPAQPLDVYVLQQNQVPPSPDLLKDPCSCPRGF